LYSLSDIVKQNKSRRIRWAGHVARMGEERNLYRNWWERPKEKFLLKDLSVDERRGSTWTLERLVVGVWSGFTWLRIGTVGGLLWMR
jgi:hypothetical protein